MSPRLASAYFNSALALVGCVIASVMDSRFVAYSAGFVMGLAFTSFVNHQSAVDEFTASSEPDAD